MEKCYCHPFHGSKKRGTTILDKNMAETIDNVIMDANSTTEISNQEEQNKHQKKHHNSHETTDNSKSEVLKEKNIISDAKIIYCSDNICGIIKDIMVMKDNFNCREKFLKIKFLWSADNSFKNVFLTPENGLVSENQLFGEHCPLIRR